MTRSESYVANSYLRLENKLRGKSGEKSISTHNPLDGTIKGSLSMAASTCGFYDQIIKTEALIYTHALKSDDSQAEPPESHEYEWTLVVYSVRLSNQDH